MLRHLPSTLTGDKLLFYQAAEGRVSCMFKQDNEKGDNCLSYLGTEDNIVLAQISVLRQDRTEHRRTPLYRSS